MGRKAAKPWAKLDFDWFEDDQVMVLESHSARDALDWAKLVAIWADFQDARIDLNNPGHLLKLRTKLKRSEKSLRAYLDRLAAIGLIDADMWAMGVVVNERASTDALKRQRLREGGAAGGRAGKPCGDG